MFGNLKEENERLKRRDFGNTTAKRELMLTVT
jgi:hypothetical protein